jgi:hypothetical protein
MLIIRKEKEKPKNMYIYNTKNHNLWEPTCENCPWKSIIQNFVKTTDLENHLIKKLINSENEDNFQNGN